MILIDALYINAGGGLRLLDYLVRTLQQKDVEFYLLADRRCIGKFDSIKYIEYMHASLWQRYKFYRRHKDDYSSVLSFGNVPPPIKLEVPVYTYFHNINLLNLYGCSSFDRRCLAYIKRAFIRSLKSNTTKWIVQTTNTQNELLGHFHELCDKVLIIPFYELPELKCDLIDRTDYVFIGGFNRGNRGHRELVEAWKILNEKGVKKTLHLTVDKKDLGFQGICEEFSLEKLSIVNHGIIDFQNVADLYCQSKAIVYPSRNESLGLGLIEAIHFGCDVIAADLPYTHSVCSPSEMFNPYSAQSIAAAIERYEAGNSSKSRLKIYNQINDLVSLIAPSLGIHQ